MNTEYHKIETLYERDERTFKLKPEMILKNPTYGLVDRWMWTEKVDGTNIRAEWRPALLSQGLKFGGKTDQAQIHVELLRWLEANVTAEKLRAVFPEETVTLYGEGYGAGIQKGGGLYSSMKKFILFDVFVTDAANPMGGWWLSDANMRDVAGKLGLDVVHGLGSMTLAEAAWLVRRGFRSQVAGADCWGEGLVGRPAETLYDKRGKRLIVKLKTKDFTQECGS